MVEKERREWPIRPKSVNLVYFAVFEADGLSMKQQGMGRTLNISSGGILLETRDGIVEGGNIFLSLGLKDDLVEVGADVAHSTNVVGGAINTGFRFKVKNKDVQDKIEEYIALFNESESI